MNDHSDPPTIINRSMPPGKIIPELVYEDLDAAVAWLCLAFGFKERLRIGNHRVQLVLEGESIVAIGGHAQPGTPGDNPEGATRLAGKKTHSIMVHIENLDDHFENVTLVGARVLNPPADYPFGERQYSVEDIGGHVWTFSQTIADVDPREWGGIVPETSP